MRNRHTLIVLVSVLSTLAGCDRDVRDREEAAAEGTLNTPAEAGVDRLDSLTTGTAIPLPPVELVDSAQGVNAAQAADAGQPPVQP